MPNPFSSLFDTLMNNRLSDKTDLARADMEIQMPEESKNANVSDFGPYLKFQAGLTNLLSRGNNTLLGSTNPFTGGVSLNAGAMKDVPQEFVNDILAHELTHSRQIQAMNPLQRLGSMGKAAYYNLTQGSHMSPMEQEAYKVSEDRENYRQDIELPKERKRNR